MTTRMRRAVAALTALTGVLVGVAAALGVLARGDGTFTQVISSRGEVYAVAANGVYAGSGRQLVGEGIGWDLFTLVVAVPMLFVGAALVARGSYRGAILAGGVLGYVTYMYLEYSVTWAFGPLFPLFVSITALSLITLAGVGSVVAAAGVRGRFAVGFPYRAWAALSIGMATVLTVLWSRRIADALAAPVPELHGETTMTVQALDLGLVVPVSIVLAIAALRRAALPAVTAFAVTFVTISAAIVSMVVSAWVMTGIPAIEPIVVFGLATAAGAALAIRMFRSARLWSAHELDLTQPRAIQPADLRAASEHPPRATVT